MACPGRRPVFKGMTTRFMTSEAEDMKRAAESAET